MPWIIRRYQPRYYDPYAYRGWGRRPRYGPQSSCLRDACLLETGCCVAEALNDNCLISALLLLPRFATTTMSAASGRSPDRGRASTVLLAAIRLYQREISAHRPPCCRFSPSCSEYAVQAIERRGAVRGSLLAARRLARCRPGGARGADPVPDRRTRLGVVG
jgi:putative membrane protein insertion efficiency factor